MGLVFWESSFNDAMETDVEETDLFSIYRVVLTFHLTFYYNTSNLYPTPPTQLNLT